MTLKIIILSNAGKQIKQDNYENVNNISAVYGCFFYRNMLRYIKENDLDITVDINRTKYAIEMTDEYDHCFVLYNRGILTMNKDWYNNLRSKIKGRIFTICPTSKLVGDEDVLLHYVGKIKQKSFKIHWMADEIILTPKQDSVDKIRILVDHEYYGKPTSRIFKNDQTNKIISSLLKYKEKNDNIEIIQICTNIKEGYKIINSIEDIGNYNRKKATSFFNIAEIYNTSSIFVVTHEECMGISTLECNMAGCKLVIPNKFIKKEFLRNLDYYKIEPSFDDKELDIDWDKIVSSLNPEKTRKKVRKLTYQSSINKIFQHYFIN